MQVGNFYQGIPATLEALPPARTPEAPRRRQRTEPCAQLADSGQPARERLYRLITTPACTQNPETGTGTLASRGTLSYVQGNLERQQHSRRRCQDQAQNRAQDHALKNRHD
jgi:hypothetical protein